MQYKSLPVYATRGVPTVETEGVLGITLEIMNLLFDGVTAIAMKVECPEAF